MGTTIYPVMRPGGEKEPQSLEKTVAFLPQEINGLSFAYEMFSKET